MPGLAAPAFVVASVVTGHNHIPTPATEILCYPAAGLRRACVALARSAGGSMVNGDIRAVHRRREGRRDSPRKRRTVDENCQASQ